MSRWRCALDNEFLGNAVRLILSLALLCMVTAPRHAFPASSPFAQGFDDWSDGATLRLDYDHGGTMKDRASPFWRPTFPCTRASSVALRVESTANVAILDSTIATHSTYGGIDIQIHNGQNFTVARSRSTAPGRTGRGHRSSSTPGLPRLDTADR